MGMLERANRLRLPVLISLAAACQRQQQHQQQQIVAHDAQRMDCPGQNDTIWVRGDSSARSIQTIPVAGPLTHIPEFHDCQKFPPKDGEEYGPLVGIWASDKLNHLFAGVDLKQRVDTAAGRSGEPDTAAASPGQVVAEIYDWDKDYEALNIKTGFNCLYLWPTSPAGTWGARMIARGPSDSNCEQTVPAVPDPDLEARAVRNPPGLGGSDVPAVARWDWDSRHSEQYAGIKCGDNWCEVGHKGFVSSRSYGASGGFKPQPMPKNPLPPANSRRAWMVKGWYDEQRLAVPASITDKHLRPGRTFATVYPHPQLGALATVEAFAGGWMPSATVRMQGPIPTYLKKLKLADGLNTISLCREGAGQLCSRPGGQPQMTCSPDKAGNMWYAKVEPAGGGAEYLCVTREDHSNLTLIEATARWRWRNDDETIWIRCAMGCCSLS